jgi:hypothetical protein
LTVIADRFELKHLAGRGGMGTVFRAVDLTNGEPIALKLVNADSGRFEREATLLAKIEAEGVVEYVAHGRLPDGRMYLAMEWLEGESLERRLESGPLSVQESLALARRLASALAAGHALGIIHRDVKPSNVILRNGRADDAVLVDFGIAHAGDLLTLTMTGEAIGTPAYMAPEQARGERDITSAADTFSLGAVLFECLTGRSAWTGEHVVAILAKILLEPAPLVSSLRPDVPRALDALVQSMLEKQPSARPTALVADIDALDLTALAPPLALGQAERRYATVLLARPVQAVEAGDVTQEAQVVHAASLHGVALVGLANGSFLATMESENVGRYARAILDNAPDSVIAIATGRAIVAAHIPVGEAIDRAAKLLAENAAKPGIYMDEATTSILEARIPRVMGRVAPFVGRDREMALLEATYRECVDDSIARATIFVGPPGIGKSRLRRELVDRLLGPAQGAPPHVWTSMASPLMSGSPFAFIGDLLGRVLGLAHGDGAVVGRARILARGADRFLGEVVGVPFDDTDDTALRAARTNPALLGDQIAEAFGAFVTTELAKSPLLIVLEDIQWADSASLRVLERMLTRAKDLPLFVVALARPAIDEVHPRLWSDSGLQRVSLEPLHRKSAERLARALLGDVDVSAIVERAAGNALFVEELARVSAAGGDVSELPPSLVAVAEARLLGLPAPARQVLRAGAIFGERFWRGAVAALVGGPVDEQLLLLERAEIIATAPGSRFANERELTFRHAIVHAAAYAMLTDEDRRLGHEIAAKWLEARVDDPALLADHYARAGDLARAAQKHVYAAELAVNADDRAAMQYHITSAKKCGVSGHLEGCVYLALLDSAVWHSENEKALTYSDDALRLLDRGSAPWFVAAGATVAALGKLGRVDELREVVARIEETPAPGPKRSIACVRAAIQMRYVGELERAQKLLDQATPGDPAVDIMLADAAYDWKFLDGRVLAPRVSLEARARCIELGDRRGALTQTTNAAMSYALLGATEEGVRSCAAVGETGYPRDINLAVAAAHAGDVRPMDAISQTRTVARARSGHALWLALLVFPHSRELAAKYSELAFEPTKPYPGLHSVALALRSRLTGSLEDAEAATALSKMGIIAIGVNVLPIAHAEALEKVGRAEEAKAVLEAGLRELHAAAAELEEWGPVYLERGVCAAELRAMARARGLGP